MDHRRQRETNFGEQIRNVGERVGSRASSGESTRRERERGSDPPGRADRPENIFNFIRTCNMEILWPRGYQV